MPSLAMPVLMFPDLEKALKRFLSLEDVRMHSEVEFLQTGLISNLSDNCRAAWIASYFVTRDVPVRCSVRFNIS